MSDNLKTIIRLPGIGLLMSLTFCLISCEDFVSVPAPQAEMVLENVFKDDATALSTIGEIYGQMMAISIFSSGSQNSVTVFEGIYADELVSYSPLNVNGGLSEFYLNSVTPTNSIVATTWKDCYAIIFKANRIIEGLTAPNSVSPAQRDQLLGEALFIRAFCHFYLTNLFGDVPLIVTSDYRVNSKVARTSSEQVYQQIIGDLLQARKLLSNEYPSMGRARPNRAAATAMLARTSLYIRDFSSAEAYATEVIDNELYVLLPELENVFLKASKEAIWQLYPPLYQYTYEGQSFILMASPSLVTLRSELVLAFELKDLRRKNWIDSLSSTSGLTKWYYAVKYKENSSNSTDSEASMVLRIAEQYLIRAEARAQLGKLTGFNSAESDINAIRFRAGLSATSALSQNDILSAIERERKLEFFTEWGHRFFDLKRTDQLNAVLASIKPNWTSTDALLPLPQSEILINRNLTQNAGH